MELRGLAQIFIAGATGALSTTGAALIGVAGAAVITALYLLRLRRRRVVVAFAPLWLGAAGAERAARRTRRLRHWLSLALALGLFAAILLGAVDLGRERPGRGALDRGGRSVVLLIDRSASMSATDEAGSRLAAARRRAEELVGGLAPADRALVASFAADATAESGFESDPRRLSRAVAGVAPSGEPGDLQRALAFAAAILRGRPRPTVVLVSDGGFTDDARRLAPLDPDGRALDVRYAPVGRRADNVGILSLAARRIPADPGVVETALVLQSFRPTAATVGVEIASGGTIVEKVELTLAPGERRRLTLPSLFAPDARLEARLTGADDLSDDDRARATIPPLPRRRILRVGDADLYLDGALLGLGRTVQVDRLAAVDADRAAVRARDYDLVIFDGVTPSAAPKSGRFLYFDPQGPGSPFATAREARPARDPVLDPGSIRREHPLLRQLDLADVNVAEAHRLALGPGDVALAASFDVPLIVARERPGLRIAALAFDPRHSDLPMRPAFPLLIANALAWATRDDVDAPAVDLGATVRDARESDTTPVRALALGGRVLAPPDPPARRSPERWGSWALMLAAALLLFDWLSYHRRWTT
ncbi:MAG TPA: VWA domain-containing protein [Polyangia bacterium]|nr:VWA domain-containing protein [Polyangia bacterium]